jgi:hypothetical protein
VGDRRVPYVKEIRTPLPLTLSASFGSRRTSGNVLKGPNVELPNVTALRRAGAPAARFVGGEGAHEASCRVARSRVAHARAPAEGVSPQMEVAGLRVHEARSLAGDARG